MPVTFTKESDMLQPAVDYFQERLPGWLWFPELTGGYGYPDITFARIDQTLLDKRIRSGIAPDPSGVVHLKHFNIGEWLTYKEFRERSWHSIGYARKLANDLAEKGFLLRRDRLFSLNPDFVNPVVEMVAIELKLSDWKTVHLQAHFNRYYADKSYAVLALKGEICHKVIDHFQKMATGGVGLMFAKPEIELALEYEPNGWAYTDYQRLFASEQILSRMGVIPCSVIQENKSTTNVSVTSANENNCSVSSGPLILTTP